ncbi:MAG: GTP-binding protein [Methanomassiliicoccales archaeon]|nr:MAG: GTP-binding protein [Methanomassiliicoccales archaeon]
MERKRYQRKICLLGDGSVGKTSLIRKYVLDKFDDKYLPTIGTKVSRKEVVMPFQREKIVVDLTMIIWDIVGQKAYQKLRQMYYQGANGALVVCDVTKRESLESMREWTNSLFKVTNPVPILFLANKSDLIHKAEFKSTDLEALVSAFKSPYFYTSAKSGANVNRAFYRLGELMIYPQIKSKR